MIPTLRFLTRESAGEFFVALLLTVAVALAFYLEMP